MLVPIEVALVHVGVDTALEFAEPVVLVVPVAVLDVAVVH
jgi:hypothetical protein